MAVAVAAAAAGTAKLTWFALGSEGAHVFCAPGLVISLIATPLMKAAMGLE